MQEDEYIRDEQELFDDPQKEVDRNNSTMEDSKEQEIINSDPI